MALEPADLDLTPEVLERHGFADEAAAARAMLEHRSEVDDSDSISWVVAGTLGIRRFWEIRRQITADAPVPVRSALRGYSNCGSGNTFWSLSGPGGVGLGNIWHSLPHQRTVLHHERLAPDALIPVLYDPAVVRVFGAA